MSDILGILVNGETKFIEFKEKYSKTILKTVSAFSNYHDGKIIIGTAVDGLVIGVDKAKEMRLSIENSINDNIKPIPNYEIETKIVENRTIVVISVFKGYQTPYVFERKAYKRADTSTVEIDKHEYDELVLLGSNLTYEELEYVGGHLNFSTLKHLLMDKLGIVEMNEDILKSLELIRNGKYTNAAAIVADHNSFVDCGMDFICYSDRSMLVFKDRINLSSDSAIDEFETAMLFYKKHINQGDVIKGAYRKSFDEVPQEAYREAVANAIIHRDYSKRGNNRVEIFKDRIEITSIGGLPVGISKEEYINGNFSNARNRIVADVFLRCRIIEKMGTGVRRIKYAYRSFDQSPEFKIFENSIQVILPRMSMEQLTQGTNFKHVSLTIEEEKLLNYIKSSKGFNRAEVENYMNIGKTKATSLLNGLIHKEMIVKVGVGKNTIYKCR